MSAFDDIRAASWHIRRSTQMDRRNSDSRPICRARARRLRDAVLAISDAVASVPMPDRTTDRALWSSLTERVSAITNLMPPGRTRARSLDLFDIETETIEIVRAASDLEQRIRHA
jgi:hypothetical protein